MKTNESVLDRVIRVIVGLVLLALYLFGFLAGWLGIVAVVLGAILLITGIVGFCPLYALLKISTKKSHAEPATLPGKNTLVQYPLLIFKSILISTSLYGGISRTG